MRIAYVQTYPIYHDLWSTEQWLALRNRDRWMPAITAAMGHEVELWGVDRTDGREASRFDSDIPGFTSYPIRLFAPTSTQKRTKFDYSDHLNAYAAEYKPDLVILKGVDGGVGTHLVDRYLRPHRIPYAFVIGGEYYSWRVPRAAFTFYETERQRRLLTSPVWRVWRRAVVPEKLTRLNKSIDTDIFRPVPEVEKVYDVISVGRLIANYKRYDALGSLSERFRVAVVGGGPHEESLRAQYPRVTWLGKQPNHLLPGLLNQGRVFMHAGLRDYYPRVLSEAAACGLPAVGFAEAIDPDVLPDHIGLRVSRDNFMQEIAGLLGDTERLEGMSQAARLYAEKNHSMQSSEPALMAMFDTLSRPGS